MVAADPIGPPEEVGEALDEFLAYCAEQGWKAAFLAVREDATPMYRERGLHSLYLGDEAILHCRDFSLEGGDMKAVRSAVTRVGKDHRFELIKETDASRPLIDELNEISEEWRDGAEERGFTMGGQDVEGTEEDFLLAIARETATGATGRAPDSSACPLLRRRPRLLARPDAPPPRLRQRPDRVSDRQCGPQPRGERGRAPLPELRRLGPAARRVRGDGYRRPDPAALARR